MASSAMGRAATVLLERLAGHLWGFPPRVMPAIVRSLGPIRSLLWFARNMTRYQVTLKSYGPIRTHLMCLTISLINDCPYCVYGDGYAFELAYLRSHGRLFPMTEPDFQALCGQSPVLIRHRLVDALQRAGLHSEVSWLDRTINLAVMETPWPTTHEELRIAHLVRMFRTLNAIAIADETEPDEAHSPLNKNHRLKLRYNMLRTQKS